MAKSDKKTQKPFMVKGLLLYLLPLPIFLALFISLVSGNVKGIIVNAISFALFMLSATLARKAFYKDKGYVTKKFDLPYRTISAGVLCLATVFASYWATANSFGLSIVLGIVASSSFYLIYGLDWIEEKISIVVNKDEEVVANAKEKIDNLAKLKEEIDDFEIDSYLENIIVQTNIMIDKIEKNQNELNRGRRFFNIYLGKTENITIEYLKNLKNHNIDAKMQKSYIDLLKGVAKILNIQRDKLDKDDLNKLDTQIDILSNQLKYETIL